MSSVSFIKSALIDKPSLCALIVGGDAEVDNTAGKIISSIRLIDYLTRVFKIDMIIVV